MIVPGAVCERAFSSVFGALCFARCEELATLSSTGDGGTGGSSLGLGDDGATAALGGLPVCWPMAAADAGTRQRGVCVHWR